RGAERTEPESRLPRWLQSASCFVALRAPPLQHPQGAECVPAARRAEAFQLEVRLPLVRVLQRPAAVLVLAVMDDVDGVGEARVFPRPSGICCSRRWPAIVSRRRSSYSKYERMERTIPVMHVSLRPHDFPQMP